MIRLLSADPTCSTAGRDEVLAALRAAFPDVDLGTEGAAMADPANATWDEVLVLLHTGSAMTQPVLTFLDEYRRRRTSRQEGVTVETSVIVPVALVDDRPMPPPPLAGRKSAVRTPGQDPWQRLVRRLQVHLGLALRQREHRLFLSYRSTDGRALAESLHDALLAHGFQPWLDEADENLESGDEVQHKISKALAGASAIVFLDTPAAAQSRWIGIEVEQALAIGAPILPLVFGPSRRAAFFGLAGLQRRIELQRKAFQPRRLRAAEVERIVDGIEDLLSQCYRRTAELAHRARTAYEQRQWQWQPLPAPHRSFIAHRRSIDVADRHSFNHCALENPLDEATLRPALHPPSGDQSFDHRVVLYDGDVLTRAQLESLKTRVAAARRLTISHIAQLDALVDSNFTSLGTP